MDAIAISLAKLAALQKTVASWLERPTARYFDPAEVSEYFEAYGRHVAILKERLPDLYADVPERPFPTSSKTTDYEGRGYIERPHLERLVRDIDYMFEVRSNSELQAPDAAAPGEVRVFISHGRAPDWREVQQFIERELSIASLELAQEPNRGRTVLQKLHEESGRCSYAVVVMTGEDRMEGGETRARENVLHEVGYFQGRYGLAKVCLLHEEGTNIPSNIHGLVYIPFPPGKVSAAFGALTRELRAEFRS
jgi:hypothetical protein